MNYMDIDKFYRYLYSSFGLEKSTANEYKSCINVYFRYLDKDPIIVNVSDIVHFFRYLYDQGYSDSYMVVMLSALRTYYDYLIYNECATNNPARVFKRRFRTERKFPYVMSLEEMKEIVYLPYEKRLVEEMAFEESSVMMILATSGIRVGEWKTVEYDPSKMQIKVYGKRNKERMIPIITKWFDYEKTKESYDYMFLEGNFEKYYPQKIEYIVRKYRRNKLITPHTFRHTFASLLIQEGIDILTLKDIMGHDSIYTTELYVHLNNKEIIDNLKKIGVI